MTAQWILGWWNLIFMVPFALALMYLVLYTVSGITFGEADADADVEPALETDADVDADVDTDIDADADLDSDVDHEIAGAHDVNSDADSDADHDADSNHETSGTSSLWQAMHLLGVGSVPVSMVLMFLLFTWGGIGFLANQIVHDFVVEPWRVAMISLPIAACGSLLITSVLTRLIGKYMPMRETYARRCHELLGSSGEAIYPIDDKFGMVSVRDDHGDLFQVACRLRPGTETIPKGAAAQLVGYSAKERMYYVIPRA